VGCVVDLDWPATLSNCGEFLKPSATKRATKGARGRGNDLGYGKNAEDVTMDDPQPSPNAILSLAAREPRMQFND
jgi:hypothetical protein